MAVITKYLLAEEILRILQGGNMSAFAKVRKEDIYASIGQVANTLLKAQHIENANEGDRIPDGSMLAFYPGIALVTYKDRCKCILPASPIYLPRDTGLAIYDSDKTNYEYLGIENGEPGLVDAHPLLSRLLEPYYTRRGLEVTFSIDLTLLGKTQVDIQLAILDMNKYSEWDPLPLVADQEYEVKKQVLAMHGVQMAPAEKLVDFNKEPRPSIAAQEQTR